MKMPIRRFLVRFAECTLATVAMAGLFFLGTVLIPDAVTYGSVKSADAESLRDAPEEIEEIAEGSGRSGKSGKSEKKTPVGKETVVSSEDSAPAENPESTFRVIKSHNGRIGVYRTDGTVESELDLAAYSLTDYDRELLRTGIVVEGREELSELLESLRS